MDENTKQVINKYGYVRYVKHWGDDLDIVNAARVSFDKEKSEFDDKDYRLLVYLLKHQHKSPFRHSGITFEIYAPMFVKNQWIKHQVASIHKEAQDGWNEMSLRYTTENFHFYTPKWRTNPENKKQGSGEFITDENKLTYYNDLMYLVIKETTRYYKMLLEEGVAAEQARCFLPAYALYIKWRWTVSIDALINFLNLRLDAHAQWEIREYAKVIFEFFKDKFPKTAEAYLEVNNIEGL
jgi:thymidylate synthase (FAD)